MSSDNYDNLDVRINILYDAVYNKTGPKYIFNPIVKHNISLIDIKMPNEYDYLENALSGKITYTGKYNNKWVFKRTSDSSHPCTISIAKYIGSRNVNDLGTQELYNPAMHYMLSELVINEKFKHALLPLMFFDIDLKKIQKEAPVIYDELKDEKSKLCAFVTEHYFKLRTLKEYLKDEAKDMSILNWKVLIFQVLYALSKISEKFQRFRHNMLNLDSIRVYARHKDNNEPTSYKLGITSFDVPNVGFDIKLTDFDFSNTNDYIRNKDTQNITENPYYDLHYFVSCLYLFIKENKISIDKEMELFINEVIPKRFLPKVGEKFLGLNEIEFDSVSSQIIVPAVVLKKNNFFKQFIKEDNMDLSISPVQNERIKMSELNLVESDIDYLTPTDDYHGPQMLARKINSNKKKSKQYYSNMKGSRKIIGPKHGQKQYRNPKNSRSILEEETIVLSDSSVDPKTKRYQQEGNNDSDDKSEEFEAESELEEESNSEDESESENESEDEDEDESEDEDDDEDEEDDSGSESDSESDKDKKKKKKKSKKHSETPESPKSETPSSETPSSSEEHHEQHAQPAQQSEASINVKNVNKRLDKIDRSFSNKLKNVPKNFVGEVPEHILNKLPSLNGNDMTNAGLGGIPIGNMMAQQMPQMQPLGGLESPMMMNQGGLSMDTQPIMMSPQMAPMMAPPNMVPPNMPMPQMPPQMMAPQMMAPQMMAPQMQQMPQMMDPQMMMNAPQMAPPQMMMGGGKNKNSKYQFVKQNGKSNDSDKDFFF